MAGHSHPSDEPPEPDTPPPTEMSPETETHAFPIVGIGASAGGLQALESFLAHVPEDSGMAFVIVQHQDPTRKGMLVELLQNRSVMPVVQVEDRMRVVPDSVYVIPPNKDMSILHGVLHLLDPVKPRGLRLPIDHFFRALGEDQHENGIAVILSGMGSDGTLGLRTIKEKTGAVFVQDPNSAAFDSMPRSAITAGLADVVAPVEDLPGKIYSYMHHTLSAGETGRADWDASHSALEKALILLRSETGHDFTLYKQATIRRRFDRRRALHQISELSDYVRFLQQNPQEMDLLFRELLIGVTSFFRDPSVWEQVKTRALATLLEDGTANQVLRAWVPACSTGEEAYSLAILFREALEEMEPARNFSLQIFATDLDDHAIERARQGVFPTNIAADVSPERLDRYFTTLEHGYRVADHIRDMVVFARQNIIMDPPFGRLDILTCRNLLIYLTPALQEKLLRVFHYSLNDGGFLLLGNAETVGDLTGLFTPVDRRSQLFRRVDPGVPAEPIEIPLAFAVRKRSAGSGRTEQRASLETLAGRLILERFSPVAVMTNENGDIIYINGHTGDYLEPPAGKANWNIFAMARDGLRHDLLRGFKKAIRQAEAVTFRSAAIAPDSGSRAVDVTVEPISEPDVLSGRVVVVFRDVAEPPLGKAVGRLRSHAARNAAAEEELRDELDESREELVVMRQEMSGWEEELKSANEELQSANEEMQSTNEELTTSKEELQSMNEELHTVNQELQNRLDELSRVDADMRNLLDSTGVATLFLDGDLCVRRFTNAMPELIKLIPSDVGRSIGDIVSTLIYPELRDDALEVMNTSFAVKREVSTENGERWYAAHVMPYWMPGNTVSGVVITFMDITRAKRLEAELRSRSEHLQDRLDQDR